jgi:hypothetical protein
MGEATVLDLEAVKAVLEEAQKKKFAVRVKEVELELASALEKQKLTESRLQSAEIEMTRRRKAVEIRDVLRAQLDTLTEYMPAPTYEQTKRELLEAVKEGNIAVQQQSALLEELSIEIQTNKVNTQQLCDRKAALRDATVTPLATNEVSKLNGISAEIRALPQKLLEHTIEFGSEIVADNDKIKLLIMISAGKWRRLREELGEDKERSLMMRLFTVLVEQSKKYMPGYVDALDLRKRRDWDRYISAAEDALHNLSIVRKHRADKPSSQKIEFPQTMLQPEAAVPEPKVEVEVEQDDEVPAELRKLTAGKRLSIYGGRPEQTANQARVVWMREALKLEEVNWYGDDVSTGKEVNRLCTSLRNGGADIVLLFTRYAKRAAGDIETAARAMGVPIVRCPNFNRLELARAFEKTLLGRAVEV